MEVLHRIADEFEKRKDDLLVFALLLGFGFFINRGVELKGLYMDDLYLWSCYGEQSFREFVFPMGGTRFRFVFYLAAWLELFFLGNHVTWMVPFNIVLNSIIAWSLYRIFVKVSSGRKFGKPGPGGGLSAFQDELLPDWPVLRPDGEPGPVGGCGASVRRVCVRQ